MSRLQINSFGYLSPSLFRILFFPTESADIELGLRSYRAGTVQLVTRVYNSEGTYYDDHVILLKGDDLVRGADGRFSGTVDSVRIGHRTYDGKSYFEIQDLGLNVRRVIAAFAEGYSDYGQKQFASLLYGTVTEVVGTSGGDRVEEVMKELSLVALGGGNDVLSVGSKFIREADVRGGAGIDTFILQDREVDVTLHTATGLFEFSDGQPDLQVKGFERFEILEGAATVYGGAGADDVQLHGVGGLIYGGAGNDTIGESNGQDTVYGGDGNDWIDSSWGDDQIYGGAGVDVIDFGYMQRAIDYRLSGTGYDYYGSVDTLHSVEGVAGSNYGDTLRGDGRANVLSGGSGNDSLYGGTGDDTIDGGLGVNRLVGGTGVDVFVLDMEYGSVQRIVDFSRSDQILLSHDLIGDHNPATVFRNHTRREGNVLIFEYDYHRIEFLGGATCSSSQILTGDW